MSPRIALVLVVLVAVLGGAALLMQRQESAQRPDSAAALGQPVLKDLQAAEVAAIRIAEPKATLTVQRTESGWVIPERGNFPADVAKVRDFTLKALGLKVGQSDVAGEKDRARLNLDQSGTRVEFNGPQGKTLSALVVGKKYFKREPENAEKAAADGRFVSLPGEEKLVYIVSDPLAQATARSAEWIDRTAFKIEKVKSLEVRYPDGSGWRVERPGDNTDWRLDGQRAGEKVDVARANAATYSLQLLELADVAPKDAQNTGLDKPTVLNVTTLDGKPYVVRVGALQGDSYYVTFSTPKPDEREKILSPHTLLIPKSKLDDTLRKRAELLESRDAKK